MTKMLMARLLAGALLSIGMISVPVEAQDSAENVFQTGMKSVVWVVVPIEENGRTGISMGSGSLIDKKQGLILTNFHVVHDIGRLGCFVLFPMYDKSGELISERLVYFNNQKAGLESKILFKDQSRDLALLKISNTKAIPKNTVQIKLAEKSPGPGARVHSIGNPGDSKALWCYAPGVVRQGAIRQKFTTGNKEGTFKMQVDCKLLTTTSPTNPGDSGGPMFNDKGEMIAVTQGGVDPAFVQGISYFIDISEVKEFLKLNRIKLSDAPNDVVTSATSADSTGEMKKDGGEEPSSKKETKKETPKKDDGAALAKKAQGKLELAQSFYDLGKKDRAITYLEELIRDYPMAPAAKEAKSLLGKWKK
jgi:S1-C subfamily serine protease